MNHENRILLPTAEHRCNTIIFVEKNNNFQNVTGVSVTKTPLIHDALIDQNLLNLSEFITRPCSTLPVQICGVLQYIQYDLDLTLITVWKRSKKLMYRTFW